MDVLGNIAYLMHGPTAALWEAHKMGRGENGNLFQVDTQVRMTIGAAAGRGPRDQDEVG